MSDGLMKTSDGTPALISSNNISQVLNVFITHDKFDNSKKLSTVYQFVMQPAIVVTSITLE